MTCIVVLLYRRLAPVVMRVASAHRLIFATVGVRALLPPRPSAVGAFVVDALVSAVTTLVTVTLLSLPPRSSSSPRLVSQRCCVSAPGARVVLQPPFLCVGTSVAVQYSPTQPGPHASRVLNLLLQNQNCFPSRASVAPERPATSHFVPHARGAGVTACRGAAAALARQSSVAPRSITTSNRLGLGVRVAAPQTRRRACSTPSTSVVGVRCRRPAVAFQDARGSSWPDALKNFCGVTLQRGHGSPRVQSWRRRPISALVLTGRC
jgi:hypothetical protein